MKRIRERDGITDNPVSSGVGVVATYGYDDLGRRTSLTLGNGEKTLYGYDAVSRLETLTHDLGDPGPSPNDNTITFTYNPASQIVKREATNSAFAWTGHGSGSASSTSDGLNRLTDQNGTGFDYDAKGNMQADGIRTYVYDSENRLADTSETIPYYYDPLGRLAGAGTPLVVHYENYVDGLIAERVAGNPNISNRHVFGPGTDEPIVWYVGPGTGGRRFLHADERGSIVAVTTESKTLLSINRYDEYGRTQTSGTNYGRFLYTGQRWFGAIDLYYYKNRFYHPNAGGRFLQPDPIGYGGGMNLYAYVGGDPVNFIDPLGLRWQPRCVGDGVIEKCGVLWVEDDPSSGGAALLGGGLNRDRSNDGGSDGRGGAENRAEAEDLCNAPLPDRSTVNRNVDRVKKWRRDGLAIAGIVPVIGLSYPYARWMNAIRKGGSWDYKNQPGGTEPQGNINYGATGSLLFPLDVLLRGAGAVQDRPAPDIKGNWYDPPPSNYGDQAADIPFIKQGADQCKGSN
jgi:RHS repeat-associated protein